MNLSSSQVQFSYSTLRTLSTDLKMKWKQMPRTGYDKAKDYIVPYVLSPKEPDSLA